MTNGSLPQSASRWGMYAYLLQRLGGQRAVDLRRLQRLRAGVRARLRLRQRRAQAFRLLCELLHLM